MGRHAAIWVMGLGLLGLTVFGQNRIPDGGFERGEETWGAFLPGDAAAKGGSVTFVDGGRTGKAVCLAARENTRVLVQLRDPVKIQTGDSLRLKVWIRNGGEGDIRPNQPGPMIRVAFRDKAGKELEQVNILMDGRVVKQARMAETPMPKSLPENWTEISGEIFVPDGATSVVPMVSATQMKGRLLVDDFSLETVSASGATYAPTPAPRAETSVPVDYALASKLLTAGQTVSPPPAGGRDLLPATAPELTSWGGAGELKETEVHGLGKGWRIATKSRPNMMHGVSLAWKIEDGVEAGDTLLLEIWIRGIELQSAAYMVQVYTLLRGEGEQMTKSTLPTGTEWKCYRLPCTSARGQKAGETVLDLQFGFDPQVMEVAGIRLLNYRRTQTLTSLPSTGFDYEGRAVGAPWRKQALDRIQELRTRELTVRVEDASGRPVAGREVSIRQLTHGFPFGTAFNTAVANGKEGERYRQELVKIFRRVTFESEMKWEAWERPNTRKSVLTEMDWLDRQGLEVWGHTLIWGGWQFLPKRLKAFEKDPVALRNEVRAHLEDIVLALKGRVVTWDVVNEAFTQRALLNTLGRDSAGDWYRQTAAIDSRPRLILNDYAILDSRANSPEQRDFVEALARDIQASGAPIHGLGFQGHMYPPFTPPAAMTKILDRFAALGLDIYITEHDINTFDEQLQADFARDFLITVMAHPSVKGFTLWGFWDGAHWKNNALLFRKDWSLKPSGKEWLDLVKGKWWTDTKATTDSNGQARLRVWMGRYRVGNQEVEVTESGARMVVKD